MKSVPVIIFGEEHDVKCIERRLMALFGSQWGGQRRDIAIYVRESDAIWTMGMKKLTFFCPLKYRIRKVCSILCDSSHSTSHLPSTGAKIRALWVHAYQSGMVLCDQYDVSEFW